MINLYRCIKTAHLTQAFGENRPCVKLNEAGEAIRPFVVVNAVDDKTCPVGAFTKFYTLLGMDGHNGRDWAAWHGEPIYFDVTGKDIIPLEGTCWTEIDADGGRGLNVVFQDPDTKEWFQRKYWHLLDWNVHDGQIVKSGDLLGRADNTGASSGDHVHDGFKPLNSANLEDKKFPNNRFTGAVDPATHPGVNDYQKDSFILDVLNLKRQLGLYQQILQLLFLLKRSLKI